MDSHTLHKDAHEQISLISWDVYKESFFFGAPKRSLEVRSFW